MNLLTVDLEEWFHVCGHPVFGDPARWDSFAPRVEEVTGTLLDELARTGSQATFFVLGWVARRYPALIARIAREGHEIACHGDLHRRVDTLSLEEFERDLVAALAAIAPHAPSGVRGYRAAEWSIREPGDPRLAILARHGFTYDSSLTAIPGLGRRGNAIVPYRIDTAGGPLVEIPPLQRRIGPWTLPAGGTWLVRSLPLWWAESAAAARAKRGAPAVFVLHPWEIDPEHPHMELRGMAHLIHFGGRRRWRAKFPRLLERANFRSIAEWLDAGSFEGHCEAP